MNLCLLCHNQKECNGSKWPGFVATVGTTTENNYICLDLEVAH